MMQAEAEERRERQERQEMLEKKRKKEEQRQQKEDAAKVSFPTSSITYLLLFRQCFDAVY